MRWRLSGDGWRLCYAGQQLAIQLDEIWPRGGATDGTIGDAAHAARTSDHNPADIEGYDEDIVFALDVHETVEGQGQALVDTLVASRDPRIRYIIHEDRIWRSYRKPGIASWTPAAYSGWNPHDNHVHISFNRADAWDWAGPWNLHGLEGENMKQLIAEIQKALIVAGFDLGGFTPLTPEYPPGADGEWGPTTAEAFTKAMIYAHDAGAAPALHDHPDIRQRIDQHQHKVIEPTEWDVVTGVPI